MKKLIKPTSLILYIISLLIIVLYIIVEQQSNLHTEITLRLILICSFFLTSYLATYLMCKTIVKPKKVMNILFDIYFIVYIGILIYLTIFSRNTFHLREYKFENYIYHIKNTTNLIPFNSIIELIKNYFNNEISLDLLYVNILGNIIALMPMAFFVPYKFKSVDNSKKFLIIITLIVVSIEIIQFITLMGICDIDDLILNVSGAYLMYQFLKIKPIKKIMSKITSQNKE